MTLPPLPRSARTAAIVSGYFNPLHIGHLDMMESARSLADALVVIVNNNNSLNQEIPLVKAAYREKRDTLSGEIWRFQKGINLARVAEELGCAGFRLEKPGQVKALLPKALAMGKPVVIDVASEEQALAPTAWLPGGGARGH